MKAAVLYKKHDMHIENLPMPTGDGENQVIKVAFCGICGTDVHLYEGDEGSVKLSPGTVPGHELSGILVETGEKVVVDPNYHCGTCISCTAGNPHYCKNIYNTGVTVNGGFAEYVTAHKSQIYKIPNHVPLSDASYAEPVSCCLHGALLAGISPGDRVLILGGGTIGLIMLQICKYLGSQYIALSEPIKEKRELALRLGADGVFDSAEISDDSLLKCGFNKVLECSGNINAVETSINVCANTGTILLFGLTKPDDEIKIKPFELFKRELTIKASYINPGTMKKAIELISDGTINTSLLTKSFISLESLPEILSNNKETMKNGKIIVDMRHGDSR